MSIDRLIAAIPPPETPTEAYPGPWEPIEAELGVALPTDYKEFAQVYGGGYLMEFFGIYLPRSHNPNSRLARRARLASWSFSDVEDAPFPFWPQPGGLLAFGVTDNGDELFWLTRGSPDQWPVVVWDRGMQEFEAFECGLTDFIAGLATGDILPRGFPEDVFPSDCLFLADPPPSLADFGVAAQTLPRTTGLPWSSAAGAFVFRWRLGSDIEGVGGVTRAKLRTTRDG